MDMGWASKKVGPFPAGVWVVVGGAGVGFMLMRSRQKASVSVPAVSYPQTVPADGSLYNNAAPVSSSSGVSAPSTNSEWQSRAQTVLIGKGVQPTVAGNALSKYLAGKNLSEQEQAIVDLALSSVGPAPSPPIPSALPTPGVNTFTPGSAFVPALGVQPGGPLPTLPPGYKNYYELSLSKDNPWTQGPITGNRGFYRVQPGDTPDSIARNVYGEGNTYRWAEVVAMNPGRNLLVPGTDILLPW